MTMSNVCLFLGLNLALKYLLSTVDSNMINLLEAALI